MTNDKWTMNDKQKMNEEGRTANNDCKLFFFCYICYFTDKRGMTSDKRATNGKPQMAMKGDHNCKVFFFVKYVILLISTNEG